MRRAVVAAVTVGACSSSGVRHTAAPVDASSSTTAHCSRPRRRLVLDVQSAKRGGANVPVPAIM